MKDPKKKGSYLGSSHLPSSHLSGHLVGSYIGIIVCSGVAAWDLVRDFRVQGCRLNTETP